MNWNRGHVIGQGSSATVSIATSDSGEVFAVKSVEFSDSKFLQREKEILSNLSNPYVIGYKGCDITKEDNKVMYNLFMEYMPGGTVTKGKIEEQKISYYTSQIVQGLEYLHSRGIVHCDIKGRNILIGESGAKIADLGCAKLVESSGIGGTPMFMAPEVARGEEQGFPADIWALGCTIIEMATGGSPWQNLDDPISIIYKIAFSEELPEVPYLLSAEAKDFLEKSLKRNPKERWTAKELMTHPFLCDLGSFSSVIKEGPHSISPTSILDSRIWNSIQETEYLCDSVESSIPLFSPEQRIRRLSSNSEQPEWRFDDSWITVRSDESANSGSGSGGDRSVIGMVGGDDDEVERRVGGELDLSSSYCSSCNSSPNKSLVARDCCSAVMNFNCLRPNIVTLINDQITIF